MYQSPTALSLQAHRFLISHRAKRVVPSALKQALEQVAGKDFTSASEEAMDALNVLKQAMNAGSKKATAALKRLAYTDVEGRNLDAHVDALRIVHNDATHISPMFRAGDPKAIRYLRQAQKNPGEGVNGVDALLYRDYDYGPRSNTVVETLRDWPGASMVGRGKVVLGAAALGTAGTVGVGAISLARRDSDPNHRG